MPTAKHSRKPPPARRGTESRSRAQAQLKRAVHFLVHPRVDPVHVERAQEIAGVHGPPIAEAAVDARYDDDIASELHTADARLHVGVPLLNLRVIRCQKRGLTLMRTQLRSCDFTWATEYFTALLAGAAAAAAARATGALLTSRIGHTGNASSFGGLIQYSIFV
jgi:hypothetical protein